MKSNHARNMLEAYDVPAILVSADYEIQAANRLYTEQFGELDLASKPKCFSVSHGYSKPCDQCGEDCPLMAAKESRQKETVLHIHQTPRGREHVNVQMIPIFDENGSLECFVELLKAVPLASGSVEEKQIAGQSRSFIKMLEKVTRVAGSNASVLLLGESGTGKELIAQLIHQASRRAQRKLVALECSGLSEQLIESELFGHRKGAFTGAYNDRPGLVEEANEGTLFLDEIGDVSLATQVKLLRLIETKTFRRVGDTQVRMSDFRLICATHKNLKTMVEEKRFRLDLYHRINVFPILIPSLSQRQEDIPLLTEHLLGRINSQLHITEAAIQRLRGLSFPGNIRELKNLLTRASILSDTNVIDEKQILEALGLEGEYEFSDTSHSSKTDPLRDNELVYIENLLKKHQGNKKRVAEELGISIRTLYRKLEQ